MSQDEPVMTPPAASKRPRRFGARLMILIRRVHLYTGLFLLPWVFLYGITGAMYNHQNLFPSVKTEVVPRNIVENSSIKSLPSAEAIAKQVVEALQTTAKGSDIQLAADHGAEFTNILQFEVHESGERKVIQINPVSQTAKLVTHPPNLEELEPVLREIRNLKLEPDPHQLATESATEILKDSGVKISQTPRPLGWSKVNFLAEVDGEPVRVTYVLKDGHVDITKHTGEDGMSLRRFFLRLHTSHGQPPHWNGRMYWSLIVDTMAIAMVCWGVSGILMWWQIKRTRLIGAIVILLSVLTAGALYLSMIDFYATTKL